MKAVSNPVIALHGGCGVMPLDSLTEAEWLDAREAMSRALRAGWSILQRDGPALEAVVACVCVLEDSPHFNAGHGAALNAEGVHELDAVLVDGATGRAGALCAARTIRNPIQAARLLLDQDTPMMLAGAAADAFAAAAGLKAELQAYFTTPRRLETLATMRQHQLAGTAALASEAEKHGTVGAVALDRSGDLAAGTSTGGFTNKAAGRVGDAAVVGAGAYARNGVCAVSCTGQGEVFIRGVVAHEVASRMDYLGEPLEVAMQSVLSTRVSVHDVGGGMVGVGADGRVSAAFNTSGMFRGWIDASGAMTLATHLDPPSPSGG